MSRKKTSICIVVVMFLAGGVNPSAAKLVVNTAKQPTNPLGRPLRICAPVEIGFQQRKGVTWNSYNHTATKRTHCFSAMLGNLETIAGFDVDLMKQVTDLLGWEYEWIVYPGYSEVLYHTRIGDCDVGFGCFNQNSMRIQCHATPSKGQSWGSWTPDAHCIHHQAILPPQMSSRSQPAACNLFYLI